jgi:hypothetical protein
MRHLERYRVRRPSIVVSATAALAALVIAGCGETPANRPAPGETQGTVPVTPPVVAPPLQTVPAPTAISRPRAPLPEPGPVRTWDELRRQAAQRIVAANPDITYTGKVPDTLLAIPVLEIELNRDGSIRKVEVLRPPREAKDTVQIAADAVRRAGPFGNVSLLPRPWKFVETFLFNDERKFKPRTLD